MTTASAASPPSETCASPTAAVPPPSELQPYPVIGKTQVSPDSYVVQFGLPKGRDYLGYDAVLPTCIGVKYAGKNEDDKPVGKSYSPISHPSESEHFDLLVKAYPYQPGGGVGAYLCELEVGDSIDAIVKKPRQVHGSPQVEGRWQHVGLVGGGTGIAPLYQLLVIFLAEETKEGQTPTTVSVLSINRHPEDILMKKELDELAARHPDRVKVTYSLTDDSAKNTTENSDLADAFAGRGDVNMVTKALPSPANGDGSTMIFVCGKDGFVSTWGGPVLRADPLSGAKKGKKIQGPLEGILKEAGFVESEVFKY
eukprot:CAMPEP_0119570022 /NCGR_PEP_ID=MMETSP1352-20130426/43280_1 /TAXON_ID=265584 /ORGANISM="Stauroneis constricta, Strain CCMP1120" /LENGTH=310 /DNA_ID=CAMNT_0007619681 /DNA_START=121 /DNA_END=1053 /DNA_ORIENTATION=+